ncbi:MAG TPA: hypothetical protein VKB93_16720 [Thermoanaerobaculia bacterium]|nr:hypothetical protein [Thermoanaerobaculia bacterium]
MKRNCTAFIVLWLALMGAYLYSLRAIPGTGKYFGAFGTGTAVVIGLMMVHGVRYSIPDWRARRRLARGERPRDGDLCAAIGPVRASFEYLAAPFSGRPCVLYEYTIGPRSTGEGRTARDYAGYGMTRCAVRTPYGEVALGSFPVLEHVFETNADRNAAVEYVAKTNFEEVGAIAMIKSMLAAHSAAPPMKRDWKIGESSVPVERAEVVEKIIAPGDTITAMGRYVAASNAIVSDTEEKGYLRVRRGGDPLRVPAVPWNAIGGFFGGLTIVVVANLVFYLLFTSSHQ